MQALFDSVATAYHNVLGEGLVGVAVHGSAVTGDWFENLSDVDFVVILDSPLTLPAAHAIAAEMDEIEIAPFAYVQATYHVVEAPAPSVVPGAFSTLNGAIDEGFVHSQTTLREAGGRWLRDLPKVAEQDMRDWSVAVARRPRQLRLIVTRLKPTVRAYLVGRGDDPITVYGSPWHELIDHLSAYEPALSLATSTFVQTLHGHNVLDAGDWGLELLFRFVAART